MLHLLTFIHTLTLGRTLTSLGFPNNDGWVTVNYLSVHEPGQSAVAPDVDELARVARLAVDKNMNPP